MMDFLPKKDRETHLIPHVLYIMSDYNELLFSRNNYHAIKDAAFLFRRFYIAFTAPLTPPLYLLI
jgi:hypothetical protein